MQAFIRELIFAKDEPGSEMYFIWRGFVAITDVSPHSGVDVALATLRPSAFFGETALVAASARRGASARALGWAQLQCLVRRDFDAVAQRYKILAELVRDHSGKLAVKTSIKHKVHNARLKTSLLVALRAAAKGSSGAVSQQPAPPTDAA